MTEPTETTEKPLAELSETELMTQIGAASKAGDFKAVAKIASALVKYQKAKEQTELEAKQKALEAIRAKVHKAIVKALQPMIDAGELDQADGIWYTNDFELKLATCRLIKSQTKARTGGGGGGGKKFDASTTSLLEKYGSQDYKDGQTFSQAYEANTDKNWRYAIRNALLKLDGVIS